MTNEQCSRVATIIQRSLIDKLLAHDLVTAERARELEVSDIHETVAECLYYTSRIEVPFPGAGETLVFTADGVQ